MRISNAARKLRVALFTVALAALSIGTVAPVSAQVVLQGLGVAKGCDSSTPVGEPYDCLYGFTNNPGVNPSNNTITITSVVDTVFASGGNVASGNILPSLSLVFSGTASCTGGSGAGTLASPYTGATSCTIPQDSGILTQAFSFYTVTNADYALADHVLGDQVSVIWQATCDVTPGCSTQPSQNQAVGQTTITPGNPQIVTSATPTIVVGQTAQDSATISGLLGNAPAGNIVFTLFGPAAAPTCTPANLVFTSAPFPVTANGTFGPATSTALAAPGNYYWIATYTDTNGSNNNVATPCGDTNETTTVQQPDANIQISPLTATNAVNTNHTLTGHVNVSNDGVTFSNAPAGTLITFSIVSRPGQLRRAATPAPRRRDRLVHRPDHLGRRRHHRRHADDRRHRQHRPAPPRDQRHRRQQRRRRARSGSTPTSRSRPRPTPTRSARTTCSRSRSTRSTARSTPGRTPRPRRSSRAPAASSAANTCTYTGGAASATCTVTITSATTGTTVVSATSAIPVNGQTITRTTSTALNTAAGGSGNASKLWCQSPRPTSRSRRRRDTNPVGTNHVLTITINAINGTIDAGPHTATASIVSGPGSFVGSPTCTYTGGAATATCTVTITSAVTGTTVVSATSDDPGQRPDDHAAPPTRPSTRPPAAAATPRSSGS